MTDHAFPPYFRVREDALEPARLRECLLAPAAGGFASFEGWVREQHDGRAVDGLRYEAYAALADAEGLRNELAAVKAKADAAEQAHQEHRKEAAKEAQRCAEKVLAAAKERDELSKATADARESAARLAGQLEAIQAQNKALMETLRGKVGGNG